MICQLMKRAPANAVRGFAAPEIKTDSGMPGDLDWADLSFPDLKSDLSGPKRLSIKD